MNNVILTGRIANEIELKTSNSGKPFLKFSVAVNRTKKDEVDFINCVAWDKTAELIERFSGKGKKILLEGSILTGNYEKEGIKIKTVEVAVQRVEFLDFKKESEVETKQYTSNNDNVVEDDEFPF